MNYDFLNMLNCFCFNTVVFSNLKVHIKSVWEKNEESLLVISYFPHFG